MNRIQSNAQMADLMIPGVSKAQGQLEKAQSDTFRGLLESALQEQPAQRDEAAGGAKETPGGKAGPKQADDSRQPEKKTEDSAAAAVVVAAQQPVQPQPDEKITLLLDGAMAEQVVEATDGGGLTAAALMEELLPQTTPAETAPQPPTQEQPDIPVLSVEVPVLDGEEAPVSAGEAPQVQVLPAEDDRQQENFNQLVAEARESLGEGKFQKRIYPTMIMDEGRVAKVPEDLKLEAPVEPGEKPVESAPVRVMEKSLRSTVTEQDKTGDELLAAVTAKPAEEPAPLELRPAETTQVFRQSPAQQVETQVIEHLEQEKMEFRIQLQPQDLGKIDVRMVLESGRLTVQILAATAKTTELLTRQAEGLAASLRLSGIDLQSIQVVPQTESQQGHMEQSLSMMMGQSGGSQEEREAAGENSGADQPVSAETPADEPDQPHTLLNYKV